MNTKCRNQEWHCEECGSEEFASDTYSGCCNELVVTSDECRGFHLQGKDKK